MPKNAIRDDISIRQDVCSEIDWEPSTSSRHIAVHVKDGAVTLTGSVHNYPEKLAVDRAVKRVRGVRSVANEVEVKPRVTRTDPEIACDVRHALEQHAFVPDDAIQTTVRDGAVTLAGIVPWDYQRRTAESAIHGVSGLRAIINSLQVRPAFTLHMAREHIEEALRRCADIDAARIRVTFHDSTVELFGSVRSWLERDEVERAAWSAPGVANVIDHLTIEL